MPNPLGDTAKALVYISTGGEDPADPASYTTTMTWSADDIRRRANADAERLKWATKTINENLNPIYQGLVLGYETIEAYKRRDFKAVGYHLTQLVFLAGSTYSGFKGGSGAITGEFTARELPNPEILDEPKVVVEDWGPGPVRGSARPLLKNEGVLIDETKGLQSRTEGTFKDVQLGQHGDPATKYLWTIDRRGINVALEKTPFPTPRGNIVHTNISSRASIGGEAWFGPDNTVTINAGSGRFGDAARITPQQWDAAVSFWESLGYKVKPIPFGKR